MVYGSSIDMFVARLGVHFVKRQLEAIAMELFPAVRLIRR